MNLPDNAPRRHWFRFSLGTLFAVLTGASVGFFGACAALENFFSLGHFWPWPTIVVFGPACIAIVTVGALLRSAEVLVAFVACGNAALYGTYAYRIAVSENRFRTMLLILAFHTLAGTIPIVMIIDLLTA